MSNILKLLTGAIKEEASISYITPSGSRVKASSRNAIFIFIDSYSNEAMQGLISLYQYGPSADYPDIKKAFSAKLSSRWVTSRGSG
jgi:hypothetical protein